jgi:alpha-tubulin suppressor-like RCC1 family protein
LRADGSLVAWGDDSYGQCWVPEDNDFVSISAGPGISMAVTSDGVAYAWGRENITLVPAYHDYGFREYPPSPYVAMAGGEDFVVGLTADGTYVTGGTGNGYYDSYGMGALFAKVAAGRNHALFLEKDVAKPGDLNNDGTVDMLDMAILAQNWRGRN